MPRPDAAKKHPHQTPPTPIGYLCPSLLVLLIIIAMIPLLAPHAITPTGVSTGTLMPLCCWATAFLYGLWVQRNLTFSGDRHLLLLTLLLLGLGTAVQYRLNTWANEWHHWPAMLPYLLGLAFFFLAAQGFNEKRLIALLSPLRWFFWFLALLPMVALLLFGQRYRGGIFLPGHMNPTEITKVCLILFTAGWLPLHLEDLKRTLFGLPCPPLKTLLPLAIGWGIPLGIALLVGDLGLLLILSLTLLALLTTMTKRWGWLLFGSAFIACSGALLNGLSTHTAIRFKIWQHPFEDPLGKGYQIGQSLCAQYAGNLWGTGINAGMPQNIPVVESDFIYAAIAEEWGLLGCALLLSLFALWLQRMATCASPHPLTQTLSKGIALLLGVQIFLNIAGVTKALPMTGITLPLFSLGGFSLIATLSLVGLAIASSKTK